MPLRRMRLETLSLPVRELLPRRGFAADHLDLDPPYQRGRVWTEEQRANLIRSLLEGLPIGALFLNDRGNGGARRVVDGKQRIEAIRAFRAGQVGIPADWLGTPERAVSAPSAGWIGYADLAPGAQRRVFDARVAVYVSHLPTADDEAELYGRVNYAGTPPPPLPQTAAASSAPPSMAPPSAPAPPPLPAPSARPPAPPAGGGEIRWPPGVR
jgi:hypothetical protein